MKLTSYAKIRKETIIGRCKRSLAGPWGVEPLSFVFVRLGQAVAEWWPILEAISRNSEHILLTTLGQAVLAMGCGLGAGESVVTWCLLPESDLDHVFKNALRTPR